LAINVGVGINFLSGFAIHRRESFKYFYRLYFYKESCFFSMSVDV
jgi:hypothetical protein